MTALLVFLALGLIFVFLAYCVDRSSSRTFEYGVEPLEPRIAPAALTAKFSAGVLTIAGDPAATSVGIVETAGSIEVFDGMTSLGTFANVKNIKANIQGGANILAQLADGGIDGSLKVLVTGVSSLTLADESQIGGALNIKGDVTAQTLQVGNKVVIGKAFSYNGGSGSDVFTIGEGTTIGGSATFTAVETGTFTTPSFVTEIAGSLRFKNAPTSLDVDIQINGAAGLNVSGKVSYAGGTGEDKLFLGGTFGSSMVFSDLSGNNALGLAMSSNVRGGIKMVTGGGNDSLGIQGGTIDGDVSLLLGSGNNSFSYGIAGTVTIGGSLSMITSSGNDTWQTFGGSMTLNGNVTINLGDGTNKMLAIASITGDKIALTTGSGTDTVAFDGSATNAAVKVFLGAGNDTIAGTLLRSNASAIFNGGDGTDHFVENILTTDPLIIIAFEEFN